jgi:hypothetical protein
VRKKIEKLENQADFGTDFVKLFLVRCKLLTVYPDLSLSWDFQIIYASKQGRLPRSTGTDDHNDLAGFGLSIAWTTRERITVMIKYITARVT